MRERIFVDSGTPLITTDYYLSGSSYLSVNQQTYWKDRVYSGMVDVVDPDFHKKSANGEIVNNPMWKVLYYLNQEPSTIHAEGMCAKYDVWEHSVFYPKVFDLTTPLSSFVDDVCTSFSDESSVAQTKAWANIDVSEIQGLASLGELPETIEMIVSLLKEILDLTLAAKRGDFRRIASRAKAVGMTIDGFSSLWLGWRYGIRPLIGEVQTLLEVTRKSLEKGQRFTSRGFNSVEPDELTTEETVRYGSSYYFDYEFRHKVSTKRTYRAGVLVEIDRAINATTALWGLDSPVEAAWELVPASFVLDWIFNVGDCIAAAVLNPSLNPLCSWVTEQIDFAQNTVCTGYIQSSPAYCNATTNVSMNNYGYTVCNVSVKRRVPLAEQFSLPKLNVHLDVAKLLDIVLIARQLL